MQKCQNENFILPWKYFTHEYCVEVAFKKPFNRNLIKDYWTADYKFQFDSRWCCKNEFVL